MHGGGSEDSVMGFEGLGRALMLMGVILLVLGVLLTFGGRLPGLGRLPGDIVIHRGNFTLYLPLATGILLSVILSIILSVFLKR